MRKALHIIGFAAAIGLLAAWLTVPRWTERQYVEAAEQR
jgi:hypothetical protein